MTGLGDLIRTARDIRYVGRIDEDRMDYPVFSDEQLDRMRIVTNVPDPYLDGMKVRVKRIRGQVPYLNPNEYIEIGDAVVIRFEDTLVILKGDLESKGAGTN